MTARSTRLVLVPGLACTEDLFADQIATLRGDLAISIADHTRHDTVSGIARAVLAAAPDRFALCGLSMGGYIAFEVMRQAPDRVERLALLHTSALPDTPEQSERRLTLIAMAQSGEFKSVRDTLWPLLVHPARHDDVALNRAVFKMMDDTGPETFIRQQKAIISRPDSRPSLGMIQCPTLVLVGNGDALIPVSIALTIADGITGSKLEIVQDCGHLSTIERPDAPRPRSIAKWLCLAAAPTFAIMALMTDVLGGGPTDMLCSAGHGSPLTGMVPMYMLMSAFHLAPWLKLLSSRRSGARRS